MEKWREYLEKSSLKKGSFFRVVFHQGGSLPWNCNVVSADNGVRTVGVYTLLCVCERAIKQMLLFVDKWIGVI